MTRHGNNKPSGKNRSSGRATLSSAQTFAGVGFGVPNSIFTPSIHEFSKTAVYNFFITVFGQNIGVKMAKRQYAQDLYVDLVRICSEYVPAALADESNRISDDNVIFDQSTDKADLWPDDGGYYDRKFDEDEDDDDDENDEYDDDDNLSENVDYDSPVEDAEVAATASSAQHHVDAAAAAASEGRL